MPCGRVMLGIAYC